MDLHEAVLQELRFQRQRCKKIWLKEGDENTSLFHKIGSARRRKNFIAELISSNDISLVTDDHLEQEIVDHFNNIYNNIPAPGWMVSNLDWHHISSELAAFLTRPFTEDEVWKNLRSLGHNKSPCPDGFTVEFFKKSWNTLKPSIMSVFHDFFVNGVINRNVNETCIALIPKKAKSLRISEYRPISLTTVLYHLMAKSLAERLKCTLPFSIAENQFAFVKDRQITYAILVANEVVDLWRCSHTSGFIIKLDIEKAFDKISWDFIDSMLYYKGFPNLWRA